jgi:hypothetical protein
MLDFAKSTLIALSLTSAMMIAGADTLWRVRLVAHLPAMMPASTCGKARQKQESALQSGLEDWEHI